MKVALVYDRVNKWGGGERVLLALHQIWPEAPLYTSVHDPERAPWAKAFDIRTSFLQKFPLAKKSHELYPLLMPMAFEAFDFSAFEMVISISSEAAKGIITKPKTFHLCYCLTPTRYLWSGYENYFPNQLVRVLSWPFVNYLRKWDKIASQRPDEYFAISETVKNRIKNYYGRESQVVYPPVDLTKFKTNTEYQIPDTKYFLVVSRLVPYKKVDLVVKVFNQLGWPLKVVGTGNQEGRLKKMAKGNIEFLGHLTEKELLSYYQNCSAVIFPQEEDFGLVPLEAQACGKPVIAFRDGGAKETVEEGVTGEFFYPQSEGALIEALEKFDSGKYLPEKSFIQAEKFRLDHFLMMFKERSLKSYQNYLFGNNFK